MKHYELAYDEWGFIDWEASGIPVPSYAWARDWDEIDNSDLPQELKDKWLECCEIAEQQWEDSSD